MHKFFLSLFISSLFLGCTKKVHVAQATGQPGFRLLGYLFSRGNWHTEIDNIDLSMITDLNIAFINPDSTGTLPDNPAYTTVIAKAHQKKVRVFMSIGGGDPPHYLGTLMEPAQRSAVIASLVDAAEKYDFDGIDVDIENSLVNANYGGFVRELSVALKAKNRLMTAALASWNGNLIGDSTLQLYDFINIMSYDKTGPWNLNNPGPHSPFEMAKADFDYYHHTRNIPAARLLVGLPFYGYGFGAGAPSGLRYREIVSQFPGAEQLDEVSVPSGGKIYYNGIPTIRQKVSFAIENGAAGIMIWELLGDTRDNLSLLKAINEVKAK